jgi:gamma-glutamylcyclotransferase (GGCT)/AIG2-like uncharacterized protein YtfP
MTYLFLSGSLLQPKVLGYFSKECPEQFAYLADHRIRAIQATPTSAAYFLPELAPGCYTEGILYSGSDLSALPQVLLQSVFSEGYDFVPRNVSLWSGESIEALVLVPQPGRSIIQDILPDDLDEIEKGYDALGEDLSLGAIHWATRMAQGKDSLENDPQRCSNLFVYGTLMRYGSNVRSILQEPRSWFLARTRGELLDAGAYPFMRQGDLYESTVHGELISLADANFDLFSRQWEELDRLEGFYGSGCSKNLFERKLITVDTNDGHLRQAWCYVLASSVPDHQLERISGGCWRTHRGRLLPDLQKIVKAYLDKNRDILVRRLEFDGHRMISIFQSVECTLEERLVEGFLNTRGGSFFQFGLSEREILKMTRFPLNWKESLTVI